MLWVQVPIQPLVMEIIMQEHEMSLLLSVVVVVVKQEKRII
jgi:hypothetical protein